LIQCIVKPREVISVYGKCQITLSAEERDTIETQEINEDGSDEEGETTTAPAAPPVTTQVDDSDEEEDEPVEVATPVPVAPEPVKKVVKKVPAPIDTSVEVATEPAEPVKKKVIKKKV
jgi:hypothetical protein